MFGKKHNHDNMSNTLAQPIVDEWQHVPVHVNMLKNAQATWASKPLEKVLLTTQRIIGAAAKPNCLRPGSLIPLPPRAHDVAVMARSGRHEEGKESQH